MVIWNRKSLFVGVLIVAVWAMAGGPTIHAQPTGFGARDFEALFEDIAGQIGGSAQGSIAIWRVVRDASVETSLSDEAIRDTLDFQLDMALSGVPQTEYRYESALLGEIQIQTVTGALAPDRINGAAIRRFGDQQNLDYLLDVRLYATGNQLFVEYRVLNLQAGALQTAGTVGQGSSAPAQAARRAAQQVMATIRPTDRVLPASALTYSGNSGPDEALLNGLTLELAQAHPGTVLDPQYYARYRFQNATEEEEARLTQSGGRMLSESFENYLRSVGVTLVLHVVTGPDGTIARLVEIPAGTVRATAVVDSGMLANMAPIQRSDLQYLQRRVAETGRAALVRQEYTSPGGALQPLSADSREHEVRRLLLADYVDHVVSSAGVEIVDNQVALQRMQRAGIDLAQQRYFDPAVRRRMREQMALESLIRVDVDRAMIGITVMDSTALIVRAVLSGSGAPGNPDFIRSLARQHAAQSSQAQSLMLYSLDAAPSSDQGVSYPFRLLLTARELIAHSQVVDPAFGFHVVNNEFSRRGIQDLRSADFERLQALGMGGVSLIDIGMVSFLGVRQSYGRLLDVGTRTWSMVRMQYDDTIAQERAREGFADMLRSVQRELSARMSYGSYNGGLPPHEQDGLLLFLQSWLSTERQWRFGHPANTSPMDHELIVDDTTSSEVDMAVFLRLLDSRSNSVQIIGNLGIEDGFRRFDVRRFVAGQQRMIDHVSSGVEAGDIVAVLHNPNMTDANSVVLANTMKQTLFENGVSLVDTAVPNVIARYNENNVIFELGATRYVLPEQYIHGNAVKLFDSGGFLSSVRQWSSDSMYLTLAESADLPALASVAVEELTLAVETGYDSIALEEAFVRDALLGGLLRSGSSSVVDTARATVFLQEPEQARYRIGATLIDNPVLYSLNPSMLVITREERDEEWFHVLELPVPGSEYTAAPGAYISTVLDDVAAAAAREIAQAIQQQSISGAPQILLTPSQFRLEDIPNQILVEMYRDPLFVMAAKIAAQLYRQINRNDLRVLRTPDSSGAQTVVPDINFQEWQESFRPPASYSRSFRVQQIISRGGERIGLSRLESSPRGFAIPPDQLLRAGQLQALQELAVLVEQAQRYADSARISDLAQELSRAEELLPRVLIFSSFHATASAALVELAGRLEAMQGSATVQRIAAEALILMGNEEYREARDLLRSGIREYDEDPILVDLLRRSEDLPQGIVGRLPSLAPINNEALTTFTVAGRFSAGGEELRATINIRPTGVYRVRVSGPVVASYPELSETGTRIIEGQPEYVVVVDPQDPVEMVFSNSSSRGNRSFSVTFERDNNALYHLTQRKGQYAAIEPEPSAAVGDLLVPSGDAQAYRRHRAMRRGGWISTLVSVTSFALAGTAYWADSTDYLGYREDYAAALADYDVATTTAAAVDAASRAETVQQQQQILQWAFYGSAIAGGVSAVAATLFFLRDNGYPSLEVDGPLFRVGMDGSTGAVALQFVSPLGR
jgi:hypothetical protein